jgi:predicted ester cyclase
MLGTKSQAETNLEAQQRMGEIIAAGEFDKLDEVLAPDLIDHDPAPDQPAGAEGIKWFWRGFAESFPDIALDVKAIAATDDYVTIVLDVTGTQTGEFQGQAPTNKAFKVRGIQVGKFVDGKITERWGATDEAGIAAQLGLG